MPIPRYMAPAQNVPKTCVNCLHRHTPSTFPNCVQCLAEATTENMFPMHETDDIEN